MIQLRGISKSHRSMTRSVSVLRNVDLDIQEGELISIVGRSGQGKSTLLSILGCLDTPDNGEYYLDGERINFQSSRQLAKIRGHKVSVIFQSFELIPHWTVLENVAMSLRFRGMARGMRTTAALDALSKVNLLQHSTKFPRELSGGEQQRCAIARTLCAEPAVILADEPTGNLDPRTARSIMDLLMAVNRNGVTVIFVTHDESLAKLAHRTAVLENGRIEWWAKRNVIG